MSYTVQLYVLGDEHIENVECIYEPPGQLEDGTECGDAARGVSRAATNTEVLAKLYDWRIFGPNLYDPVETTCPKCEQNPFQCPGHFAVIKCGFTYVMPMFSDVVDSLLKKRSKRLHNVITDRVEYEKTIGSDPRVARFVTDRIVVRPPNARLEYMKDKNLHQLMRCQFAPPIDECGDDAGDAARARDPHQGGRGRTKRKRSSKVVYRLCEYYPILNKLLMYHRNGDDATRIKIINMIYDMTIGYSASSVSSSHSYSPSYSASHSSSSWFSSPYNSYASHSWYVGSVGATPAERDEEDDRDVGDGGGKNADDRKATPPGAAEGVGFIWGCAIDERRESEDVVDHPAVKRAKNEVVCAGGLGACANAGNSVSSGGRLHMSLVNVLSHKKGLFRQLYGGVRPTYTVRAVIVCATDVCMHEIRVPPRVCAYARGKSAFVCRQPTLYSSGMQLVRVLPFADCDGVDNVIGVHHELAGSFNQDYDGDEMTLYICEREPDRVLNSLPILLFSEINGVEIVKCSYNTVTAMYVWSRWPSRELAYDFADHLGLGGMRTFGDLMEHVVSLWTCGTVRNPEKLIRHVTDAHGRRWTKSVVRWFEAFVLRLVKGREEHYIMARKEVCALADAFMTHYSPNISASVFARAHERFQALRGPVPRHFDSMAGMVEYWNDTLCRFRDDTMANDEMLSVLVDSEAKASALHMVQAVGCVGPVVTTYYPENFRDMCRRNGVSCFSISDGGRGGGGGEGSVQGVGVSDGEREKEKGSGSDENENNKKNRARESQDGVGAGAGVEIGGNIAWVPDSLYGGVEDRYRFVMACNSVENMVRSIVSTSEGGYWRRSLQFTMDGLRVEETYSVCDKNRGNTPYPPVFNPLSAVTYISSQFYSTFECPYFLNNVQDVTDRCVLFDSGAEVSRFHFVDCDGGLVRRKTEGT